jgi:hypothetical protein
MATIQLVNGVGAPLYWLLAAGDGTTSGTAGYALVGQGVPTGTAANSWWVQGPVASGSAVGGNPVLVGGSDGTNAQTLKTDTNGILKTGDLPLGTAVVVSSTGAATAQNQTLPAVSGKTNYLSGFTITGLGATAAASIQVTTTGLASGQLTFTLPIPAGVTVGVSPLTVKFNPPLPASGTNVAIVVSCPSFGSGNTVQSSSAWGFVV